MISKIKTFTYFSSILIGAIFVSLFIGATVADNPFDFNSLIWWLLGLILMGFIYLIIISIQKIPTIIIINDTIELESKRSNIKINIADIEKLVRVKSMINGWYSRRGGLQIYTKKDMIAFPYHVYSNESQMLQLIYQSHDVKIERNCKFRFKNFLFIKYFYRNFGSFFLVMALVLISILISKEKINIIGIVGISATVLPMIAYFFMSSKFLKLENGYLTHISPLILKRCKYDLEDIEYANSISISTGANGTVKNLTIELIDKRILTLNAGLNRQKTIDKIAEKINSRSI